MTRSEAFDEQGQEKILAFKPNIKPLTTHYAKVNGMASPTQTIVNKGKPNPLIAEDLLKILKDLIPFDSSKSSTISFSWNNGSTKQISHVKAFTSNFFICSGGIPPVAFSSFRSIEA